MEACPLTFQVLLNGGTESIGNPRFSRENLGNIPQDLESIKIRFKLEAYQGYKTSKPYIFACGEIIEAEEVSGLYELAVPVYSADHNRAKFVKSSENHFTVLALKGNGLEIYGFGVIIFEGKLLKIKHKKYDLRIFKVEGLIKIPELGNGRKIAQIVAENFDTEQLPDFAGHKPSAKKDSSPKNGLGIVQWVDPFAQKVAVLTSRGPASCVFRNIRNLKFLDNTILLPREGDRVKINRLKRPSQGSATTFKNIVASATIIAA